MKSVGFLLVVLSSLASFAATLRVPQDSPTVQAAVASSVSGDTVVVSPGLYAIPASACTLANGSQHTCGLVLHDGTALVGSGPAQTILDFSGAEIGILLLNGTATVKLFHLQNAGTALYAYVGSNITGTNLIITNSNLGMEVNQGNSYTIVNTTIDGVHDPKRLLPDLHGVEVYALGVDGAGKDMRYWQALRDFWTAYFKRTGAILKTYSVLRDPPNLGP